MSISTEKNKNALLKFFEDSAPIFSEWQVADIIMSKRPEKNDYRMSIYDDARAIIDALYKITLYNADEEDVENLVLIAEKHLSNIIYESFSIIQMSLCKEIAGYKEEYNVGDIRTIYPKYLDDHQKKIIAIRDKIPEIAKKRNIVNVLKSSKKDGELRLIKDDIIFLNDVVFEFLTKQDEFTARQIEEKEKNKKDFMKQVYIAIIGAIIGVILTVLTQFIHT